MEKLKITQIVRKSKFHNSVDKLLDNLNEHLSVNVELKKITCPYPNDGIINKIKNILWVLSIKDDIVHVTGDVTYLSTFLFNSRVIITVLDLGMPGFKNSLKKYFIDFFWNTLPFRKAVRIIAISDKTKEEVVKKYPFTINKIKRIYVPLSRGYNFIKIKKNNIFNVLQIATTLHNKNIERSIEALKNLPVKYHFVGQLTDKHIQNLKKLKIDFEVFYNISEKQLIQLYKSSNILLFPSLYEGFGMPIIEAQAMSCCVITSNFPPMNEVAGDGALFVNPYDIDEISNSIIKIINNETLRSDLIEKGHKNLSKFNSKHLAKEYFKIYKEVFKINNEIKNKS